MSHAPPPATPSLRRTIMTVRVAINGFGRIGRNVLRTIIQSGRTGLEVVGINDLGLVEPTAHLCPCDRGTGRFNGDRNGGRQGRGVSERVDIGDKRLNEKKKLKKEYIN